MRQLACVLLLCWPSVVEADYLEVRRAATLRTEPNGDATIILRPDIGSFLILDNDQQTDGYYFAHQVPNGQPGWIYRTLVRRYPGQPPVPVAPTPPPNTAPVAGTAAALTICSFNIQFLGSSTRRDAAGLADEVASCDVVAVQELVAPPYPGTFPNGDPFKPDPEAAAFFDAMRARGFNYVLSEEDTGAGQTIHLNSSATEWWVSFYKPGRVSVANDLPRGFLAADRSANPDYERVPYAFPFRSTDGHTDFVLISVHLRPGSANADAARRRHELTSVQSWISAHSNQEHDFLVLGDMNFEDCDEIGSDMPTGLTSLNEECLSTNTNVNGPRPYDNILYNEGQTIELDGGFGFFVFNLITDMRSHWNGSNGAYPGDPYNHNQFRAFYSDHHPVAFRLDSPAVDDDQ